MYEEPILFSCEHFHSQTPFVDRNNKIAIHETFLSYIWIVGYSMLVLYDEAVAKPMQNAHAQAEVNVINKKLITHTEEFLQYGLSLIRIYSLWDKSYFANPEEYSSDEEFYILRANTVFTFAVNFILCHEFAHVEKEHVEAMKHRKVQASESKTFEQEADDRAIELMLAGRDGQIDKTLEMGILIGLGSMLYFKNNSEGGALHPDVDVRIKNFLTKLDPSFDAPLWGIAALFIKLWDDQFNLNFSWPKEANDFKEIFNSALKQIEDRKLSTNYPKAK